MYSILNILESSFLIFEYEDLHFLMQIILIKYQISNSNYYSGI